jgi:hypothetical protein
MVFMKGLLAGAAPALGFPRCLNTPADFVHPACQGLAGVAETGPGSGSVGGPARDTGTEGGNFAERIPRTTNQYYKCHDVNPGT